MFVRNKKMPYLCNCYPEYNLFTLKKLIPIENNAALCEESGILFYVFCPLIVKLFDTFFV